MFKVVEVEGYICEALHPASPSPSKTLSEYFGRSVHPGMKDQKHRACGPTQTFPEIDYHAGFPLLVASGESLGSVGDVGWW